MMSEEEIEQELKEYMVLAEDYDTNKMFEPIVDEDIF